MHPAATSRIRLLLSNRLVLAALLGTLVWFADQPTVRLIRDTNAIALPTLYVAGGAAVQAPNSITQFGSHICS